MNLNSGYTHVNRHICIICIISIQIYIKLFCVWMWWAVWAPKDVYMLILRTCEDVMLHNWKEQVQMSQLQTSIDTWNGKIIWVGPVWLCRAHLNYKKMSGRVRTREMASWELLSQLVLKMEEWGCEPKNVGILLKMEMTRKSSSY